MLVSGPMVDLIVEMLLVTTPYVPWHVAFDMLFDGYKWYRRIQGGHWEQWLIDHPHNTLMWLRNSHGVRPGLGVSRLACEDWVGLALQERLASVVDFFRRLFRPKRLED